MRRTERRILLICTTTARQLQSNLPASGSVPTFSCLVGARSCFGAAGFFFATMLNTGRASRT